MCHPGSITQSTPRVEQRDVYIALASGEELPALCCIPEQPQTPAILVVPDIYGQTPFYRWLAAVLSAQGYVLLLPDYFFRLGELPSRTREAAFARRERLDEVAALDDLEQALHWLEERPEIEGCRRGLLGFCLGGTLALDLCARREDLAAVCYYPFPEGVAQPCLRHAPRPIDLAGEIHGPTLAFWGERDLVGLAEIERFERAMRDAGRDYEQHLYEGVGHGFLGGLVDECAESEAARDSWRRSLSFFQTHLPAE
jgi:dienelactone hydrolase